MSSPQSRFPRRGISSREEFRGEVARAVSAESSHAPSKELPPAKTVAGAKASFQKTEKTYRWPPGLERNLIWVAAGRFWPRDPIKLFQHLADTYGDIAHYKIGNRHVLFLNHPDLIREVLVDQNDNFVKERTVRRMKMLVGEGLITSEGEFHRRQRRLSQPAFHRQRIAAYGNTMVSLAQRAQQNWEPGTTVDISQEMMELTLSIVARTLFGIELGPEVRDIRTAVNTIMGLYHFLVMLPRAESLQHYPLPGLMRFKRARAQLDAIVYRMIAARHRQGGDEGDLLSMLLQSRDDGEGGDRTGMSDLQLRDEIMTIFLAGYETIANALTWTWYLLSQNPEAEEALHREVDSVLGDRPATVEDLPRLTHTEMVLAESMRLYPPAWAQGRQALRDFNIGDYSIPAQTNVFMSQFIMHRNPKYFEDPSRYDPSRWTPEARAARPKFSYFPFGGGPRQCVGESFAWMEGILVLATIARGWRMTLYPGHRVQPQALITLRPRYGMRMTLQRR